MSDSEEDVSIERQVKVVLAGAPQVGKTAIANRYINNIFNKGPYQPSVGVEFYLKRLALGLERNISVQLWDIAGSSLSGRMTDKYLYGAHALVLVYDVTASGSLDALQEWVIAIKRSARGHDRPPLLALVANKADMEHLRQVKSERHHRFALDHGMGSYVVSAKTGEGVSLTFQKIAAELLGVKLSRWDMEQHQAVVKAEIQTYHEAQLPKGVGIGTSSMSAICSIM